MNIIIYGSDLCSDCKDTKELFEKNKIEYIFKDITKDLSNLKEFLSIRDTNSCYNEVKKQHGIGIPCIVKKDGSVTLDPNDLIK